MLAAALSTSSPALGCTGFLRLCAAGCTSTSLSLLPASAFQRLRLLLAECYATVAARSERQRGHDCHALKLPTSAADSLHQPRSGSRRTLLCFCRLAVTRRLACQQLHLPRRARRRLVDGLWERRRGSHCFQDARHVPGLPCRPAQRGSRQLRAAASLSSARYWRPDLSMADALSGSSAGAAEGARASRMRGRCLTFHAGQRSVAAGGSKLHRWHRVSR